MSTLKQSCPRRMTDFGPWEREPDLDSWTTGHGLAGQGDIGLSCSFCGSLHPDRFMELVRAGWTVGPTDKGYKAYLNRTPTEAEVAAAKAHWAERNLVANAVREVGERDGKTPEQIAVDLDQQWAKSPCVPTGNGAKFYFQHLSEQQRAEFIALHNTGAMRIGEPGYFYQPPYFTRPEPSA